MKTRSQRLVSETGVKVICSRFTTNLLHSFTLRNTELQVPSVKNGLSFVAINGQNQRTTIVLEHNDIPCDPRKIGTRSHPIIKLLGKPVVFCALCGNYGKFCHDKRYGRYCIKAVYAYLHNTTKVETFGEDWTAYSSESVIAVFKKAYNEKRKCDLEDRFGYYNPNWVELPTCLSRFSLQEATDIKYNPMLIKELKIKNEEGYQKFCNAKGQYNA